MKITVLFVLLLAAVTGMAQNASPAVKQKVDIVYTKHVTGGNLADYVDTADIRTITRQTGKALCKEILQNRSLPACYTSLLNNRLTGVVIYLVAEYTTTEPDETGLGTQETTYAILEVPFTENKNAAAGCNFDKTFYIRIPADDIRKVSKDARQP